jgi:phage terminase large subunit
VSDRLAVLPQYLLPKQALTALAGSFARARLGGLTTRVIRWFVGRYGVDMGEAANPDIASVIYSHYQIVKDFPEHYDRRYYGVDFGFNVPTAVVEVREFDGIHFVRELFYKAGVTNQELIDNLKTLDISGEVICDAAEPNRIEELYRAGFDARPAIKDVEAGIDYVKSRKLLITDDSRNLIKEIQTYSYKKDRDGNYEDSPCKYNDHLMDSMRYALFSMRADEKSTVQQIKNLYWRN